MERFNSGKIKNIFRVNFDKYFTHAWQQEEERKGDMSTALMFQEYFISELFKDIQDATSLMFHYRTMLQFSADSSIIFTIVDVRYVQSGLDNIVWEIIPNA